MIKPNTLTLFRILLAILCPFLLAEPALASRVAGFFVFLFAGLTDLWDGYLARKTDRVTSTGKILDPIADKILNLGTMFTFAYLKIYPVWAVLLIFVREVLITGIRLRYLLRKEVIAAEFSGKLKTGLQIVSIAVSYFYLLARDYQPGTLYVGVLHWSSYLFMGVAIAVTLYSGFRFFSDSKRFSALHEIIATCGYVGYLPKMPGTFGTLAGILIYWFLPKATPQYLFSMIVLIALAIWSSGHHAKNSAVKDPSEVVLDEVVGILMALSFVPLTRWSLLLSFVLFRVFDILKPPPIRKIESCRGGWGIVLDDLLAGLYTGIIVRAIFLFVR